MNNFSKIRKATQFTSLAASSMIFIIALYGILIHNDSYFEIGLLLFGFIIVGGIFLSPILGRFWCGWLCPRGTFLEYILEKVSKKRKIPDILRSKAFKLFIASIMTIMFVMVLLDMNPLLTSEDELDSLGGFIVFMCIVTHAIDLNPSGDHLYAKDMVRFLSCRICSIPPVKE